MSELSVSPDDSASQVGHCALAPAPGEGSGGGVKRAAAPSDLLSMMPGRGAKARRQVSPSGPSAVDACAPKAAPSNRALNLLLESKASQPAMQSLHDQMMKLPKSVRSRVRIVAFGYGDRLRDCVTCGIPCNACDPILGEYCFVKWEHLEVDGATLQGFVCFYCCGILRRRFRGWKLKELLDHLRCNSENKARYDEWRKADRYWPSHCY